MALITGTRGTGNIASVKQVIDMSERIALLQPDKTPFMVLMKRLKANTEAAENPKFSWMEDDLCGRWDAVNNGGGYTNVATDIVVDNGDIFSVGHMVKVPRTGEVMRVTAVAGNTVTVVRGQGTTAAAALVNDDPLVIVGNTNEEGSGARIIKSTTEVEVFNYTQIFKSSFGLTNTAQATKMYGGQDLSYQQMKKGIEHLQDMARAFLFGEKKLDTTGTHPRRSTAGLLSFMTQSYDAAGQLTKTEFDNNVSEVIFKYGSSTKTMFCSARLLSVINGWAESDLQVQQGEETYGLAVRKYITPFGQLNLVHEPLFEGAVYGGYGAIVDIENLKYRPLKGRDTRLETNIQANDADERKDQYITEAGIEVRLPKTHFLLTGVTS